MKLDGAIGWSWAGIYMHKHVYINMRCVCMCMCLNPKSVCINIRWCVCACVCLSWAGIYTHKHIYVLCVCVCVCMCVCVCARALVPLIGHCFVVSHSFIFPLCVPSFRFFVLAGVFWPLWLPVGALVLLVGVLTSILVYRLYRMLHEFVHHRRLHFHNLNLCAPTTLLVVTWLGLVNDNVYRVV